MSIPENRNIVKQNILRVGINQIVQVVWKLQLGSIDQLGSYSPEPETTSKSDGYAGVMVYSPITNKITIV